MSLPLIVDLRFSFARSAARSIIRSTSLLTRSSASEPMFIFFFFLTYSLTLLFTTYIFYTSETCVKWALNSLPRCYAEIGSGPYKTNAPYAGRKKRMVGSTRTPIRVPRLTHARLVKTPSAVQMTRRKTPNKPVIKNTIAMTKRSTSRLSRE